MLLYFNGHVDIDAGIGLLTDAQGVVKLGQVLGLELDVEHGSDDLNDLADVVLLRFRVGRFRFLSLGADSCCHD